MSPAYRTVMQATASRAARVRVLQWTLLPFPFVIAAVFWSMSPAERLKDFGDGVGAVLLPALLVGLAAALPLAAFSLAGRYVLRIAVSPDGERLQVDLLLPWGRKQLEGSKADFVAGPVVHSGGGRIQTPVFHLKNPAGKQLLVDVQADYPDGLEAALEALSPNKPARSHKRKRR